MISTYECALKVENKDVENGIQKKKKLKSQQLNLNEKWMYGVEFDNIKS